MIIQKGIAKLVYPKFPIAVCQNADDLKASELMLKHHPEVTVEEIDCINDVLGIFDLTKNYIRCKIDCDKSI